MFIHLNQKSFQPSFIGVSASGKGGLHERPLSASGCRRDRSADCTTPTSRCLLAETFQHHPERIERSGWRCTGTGRPLPGMKGRMRRGGGIRQKPELPIGGGGGGLGAQQSVSQPKVGARPPTAGSSGRASSGPAGGAAVRGQVRVPSAGTAAGRVGLKGGPIVARPRLRPPGPSQPRPGFPGNRYSASAEPAPGARSSPGAGPTLTPPPPIQALVPEADTFQRSPPCNLGPHCPF